MKNIIFLIMALLGLSTVQAQNLQTVHTYYDPLTKAHIFESYTVVAGTPTKQGLYRQYDANGILVKEMTYVKGYRNGVNKEFYSSDYDKDSRGKMGLMCNYKNDDLDGIYEEYQYPKGVKWTKMTDVYKEGKVVKSTKYYLNGKPKEIIDDKGISYEYYENGQKKSEKNNITNDFTSWFDNGKIKRKGHYSGKQAIGEWTGYYLTGSLWMIRQRNNAGELQSIKYYWGNGILADSIIQIGDHKFYHVHYDSLGNKEIVSYSKLEDLYSEEDPILQGKFYEYYPSGKLHKEGNFVDNKADGDVKVYFENGNIQLSGKYNNNKQYDVWKTFDESGKLLTINKYDLLGFETGLSNEDINSDEIRKLVGK